MYNMKPKVQRSKKVHPRWGIERKTILDKIGHFPRQGEMNTNVTQQKVIYND